MGQHLHIEDQVHPQDGDQEPAAGGLDHTPAASLRALRVPVASRYSCTQRSITAEVFSTLVNWPTTSPTGLNATSTLSSGYLCVAATAMPDTMYCNGIPSGFGFSGSAQASVQSLRNMRAGVPVNERLR